jgi:acetylornithine/succinyldiaminopimelate/putrescine aminotransferase
MKILKFVSRARNSGTEANEATFMIARARSRLKYIG